MVNLAKLDSSLTGRASAAWLAILALGCAGCWDILGGDPGKSSSTDESDGIVQDALIAVQVDAGGDYTCALLRNEALLKTEASLRDEALLGDGAVCCWGVLAPQLSPEIVALGRKATKVVVGDGGTRACALLDDGRVMCWGKADLASGQDPRDKEGMPEAISGLSNVRDIWTGYEHFCAVNQADDVRCWAEEGEATMSEPVRVLRPTAVFFSEGKVNAVAGGRLWRISATGEDAELAGVMQLSAGRTHWCAVVVNGPASSTVECDDDALKDPSFKGRLLHVTPSSNRVCALVELEPEESNCDPSGKKPCPPPSNERDVIVKCGGDEFEDNGDRGSIDDAAEIALGSEHGCVRRKNGEVLCWGKNDKGQLGNAMGKPWEAIPLANWPAE
jgi:hypothetical protein